MSAIAGITIPRRAPQATDVQIEILYCGICHTDVHFVRNEFAPFFPTTYPCVPGHEIVGGVAKAGEAVTKFKAGDLVAVGCMVDSDRTCDACREGEGVEQFCASQPIFTYNAPDKHLGGVTYGGYSQSVVVDQDFVLRVPGPPRPGTFDFIIDTVPDHNLNAYINVLKRDGTLSFVGAPPEPLPLEVAGLLFGRKKIAGSLIGGIRETQEMLDFCGKHNVTAEIEKIDAQQINQAYERLLKNDVKYRFVIDIASLK